MYKWQVDLEYPKNIFYTWKGQAVTEWMALEYAKESGKIKGVTDNHKFHRIKMLTVRSG